MSLGKAPSPATTLVILLGASNWPHVRNLKSSEAFSNSVFKIKKYFANKLKVPSGNLLDLFNSDKSASDIDEEICNFLVSKINQVKKTGNEVRDLVIYYVGHGGFTDGDLDFFLAVRTTRENNLGSSSILIKALATSLKNCARHVRRTLILDCCFSAAAYSRFQSSPEQTARMQSITALNESMNVGNDELPVKGTALFCSSNHVKPSLIAPDGHITMFTDGLVSALESGFSGYPEYLSLRTLGELTEKCLIEKYRHEAPRPEIHSPDQSDGDIAKIPFFPNFATPAHNMVAGVATNPVVPPTTERGTGKPPVSTGSIIGRDVEFDEIRVKLQEPDVKIITLTGCNGIGKTRLALEIAAYLNKENKNVRFIPLASINHADHVPNEIAAAVGYPEIKSADHLISFLRNKVFILIIDNFEHVVEASGFLLRLSENCPRLKFLVTSESKLNLLQEQVIELLPLGIPQRQDFLLSPDELTRKFSSVELFVSVSQSIDPEFKLTDENSPGVAEICMRTKGLPLSIEAIASHIKELQASEVLDNIKRSGFLWQKNTRFGILELYKTVQETNGWNYSLLSENEKQIFRFLAVFEGGCTTASANAVIKSLKPVGITSEVEQIINQLVVKRLIRKENQQQFDGQYRYFIPNTTRLYALDRLKINGEIYDAKNEHALYFLKLAEEAEPKLTSGERDSGRWLDRLSLDYDNLRAALEWCLEYDATWEIGLRLGGSLFWFWNLRGELSEGRKWLESLVEKRGRIKTGNKEFLAKALYGCGGLEFLQSDYDIAYQKIDESIRIWRELKGEEVPGVNRRLGYSLIILGVIQLNQGHLEESKESLEESRKIFEDLEDLEDNWGKALVYTDLGRVFAAEGEGSYPLAADLYNKSQELWKSLNDRWGLPLTLNCLGVLACKQQDFPKALAYLNDAYILQSNTDKWGRASILKDLGAVYYEQARAMEASNQNAKAVKIEAIRKYSKSLLWHHELGRRQLIADCFEGFAKIAVDLNEPDKGVMLFAAAEQLRRSSNIELNDREKVKLEEFLERLKDSMGQQDYQRAWNLGDKKSLEDLVKNCEQDARDWIAELADD